ncbi:hypothetical protein [Roseibium sp.]|uniref:hypothetical protein n=1 Tax=Roseibium sp. TaxID=1936156 RepID=UPI003B5148B6
MTQDIISVDGGSKAYWAELRLAYGLIAKLEARHRDLKTARAYVGYLNADGDEVVWENTEPYDRMAATQEAVKEVPRALSVLEATGRTDLLKSITF